MKHKLKKMINHPLIHGSAIVVLGNLIANLFNFLFNLYMGRNLSVENFGILAAIISLITFPALLAGSINPMVVRFAGSFFAGKNYAKLKGLYMSIVKTMFLSGILITTAFFVLIDPIGRFFQIQNKEILMLAGIMVLFSFVYSVNIAFLQAKLAFSFLAFTNIAGTTIKLLLGIILVFLGYNAFGAVTAVFIAGLIMYAISFYPLRFIFDNKNIAPKINKKELFLYGGPSALTFFALTSLITSDIILVKHLFDPHQAGLYAGLSLVGRVIFFISSPIGTVMFPLIVQKHAKNENFTNTFKLSLFLVFGSSILITIFYLLLPEFSLLFFLKKEEYLVVTPLLAPFALFIALFSALSIVANFYLSIKKTRVFVPLMAGAILQVILILLFHETFMQIIIISLSITSVLLVLFLLYYPHAIRKRME